MEVDGSHLRLGRISRSRRNCKCDLTANDEAPTAVPDENGQNKAHDGLENNPGKDGKLFSDKHP